MRRTLPGLLTALSLVACSADPPDGDDDTAVADDDTAGVCEGITWGPASAFTVGDPVGNWALQGYVDDDGDGIVEAVDAPFTLQDIQCRGHESLVVVVGDTT